MYYTCYSPLNIWMTFKCADKKKLLTFYLCVWFGIVGAFGGGVLVAVTLLF